MLLESLDKDFEAEKRCPVPFLKKEANRPGLSYVKQHHVQAGVGGMAWQYSSISVESVWLL
jgi:hypothetical protein